jgi:2-phosphoglycerate kinase
LAQEEAKPGLASLVAEIAREECKKLHEKRLTGLEEELAALYKTLRRILMKTSSYLSIAGTASATGPRIRQETETIIKCLFNRLDLHSPGNLAWGT